MPLSLLNHPALALFAHQHAHSHFCPQHWLLCHLGLYYFEFEAAPTGFSYGLSAGLR